MKIDDRVPDQVDPFEARLMAGLDAIASATSVRTPTEFRPDDVELIASPPPRRSGPALAAAAAVTAVTLAGLVALGPRSYDAPGSRQSPTADAGSPPPAAEPRFRFETPTVRLDADSIEVITPAGVFVPTADVIVDGDPGMPNQYTTLELTWHDTVEQRINIYFTSDGKTWWANEIRAYDGTARGEWAEPAATGRFFESPLGSPYTGDLDLPTLRITGMTLQAFTTPTSCENPTSPVALVADYPMIRGWAPGGYGASFQVYDTATCTPLPIDLFTFEFSTDDPDVAVVTHTGRVGEVRTEPTTPTKPTAPEPVTTSAVGSRPEFDDIKARVGLDFLGPGMTTLRVTTRDSAGTVVGTVDIPINVTGLEDAEDAPPTTTASAGDPRVSELEQLHTVVEGDTVESIAGRYGFPHSQLDVLVAHNGWAGADVTLSPGDVVRIPPGAIVSTNG